MIHLNEEIASALANAMTDRQAIVAAYVDRNGDPHTGFYGSLHVYSDDQVALWARNPESELVATIPTHPKIEFVYANFTGGTIYRLAGSARLAPDDERDRVYEGIHEIEKGHDPDRKGYAVIVDLVRVSGRDASGIFTMERD